MVQVLCRCCCSVSRGCLWCRVVVRRLCVFGCRGSLLSCVVCVVRRLCRHLPHFPRVVQTARLVLNRCEKIQPLCVAAKELASILLVFEIAI